MRAALPEFAEALVNVRFVRLVPPTPSASAEELIFVKARSVVELIPSTPTACPLTLMFVKLASVERLRTATSDPPEAAERLMKVKFRSQVKLYIAEALSDALRFSKTPSDECRIPSIASAQNPRAVRFQPQISVL